MRNSWIKIAVIAWVIGALWSCNQSTIYSHYVALPLSGWDKDSALVYDVPITDTLSSYDVLLNVRHGIDYPYQNLWLEVALVSDSVQTTDTIEFYLADQRGRWLGNGSSNLRQMPVLYKTNYQYSASGNYRYVIRQLMREDKLRSVSDIGIEIKQK